MDFVSYLFKYWSLIVADPLPFIVVSLLASGIGFSFATLLYSASHGAMEARVKLAEDRVASYKEKADGRSPEDLGAEIAALKAAVTASQGYGIAPEGLERALGVLRERSFSVIVSKQVGADTARRLYDQLCRLFASAGWDVEELDGVFGLHSPPDCGVALLRRTGTDEESLHQIRRALNAARLDFVEVDLGSSMPFISTSAPQIALSSRNRDYVPASQWS